MKLGQSVIVGTAQSHNGSHEQPAIINRVWSVPGSPESTGCANVMVLPDCGSPYPMTSVLVFQSREAWVRGGSMPNHGYVA